MHSDAQSDAVGTVGSNTQYSTVDAMQYSFFCGTKYLTVVMRLGQIQSAVHMPCNSEQTALFTHYRD